MSDLARRAGRAGAAELAIGYWSSGDILLNRYHQDVASKGGVLFATEASDRAEERVANIDIGGFAHWKVVEQLIRSGRASF